MLQAELRGLLSGVRNAEVLGASAAPSTVRCQLPVSYQFPQAPVEVRGDGSTLEDDRACEAPGAPTTGGVISRTYA